MPAYYYNGKAARRILGCSRECFLYLIEVGAIHAKRTKIGGYRLLKREIDDFNCVSYLLRENMRLRNEISERNQVIKNELSKVISKYLNC